MYAALVADPGAFFDHEDPTVRRLAVASSGSLLADASALAAVVDILHNDSSPRVRAEAAEALGAVAGTVGVVLQAADDADPLVREAVATALGAHADPAGLPWLVRAADGDPDRLVREAAIAALGEIGDDGALEVLLRIVATGPPQLRRRCVVALSVFDGPEVENALRAAARDRNPMVREVAEMVVGRPTEWEPIYLNPPGTERE